MPIKNEPLTIEEMQYIDAALYLFTYGTLKKGSPAPSMKKEEHIRIKLDHIYKTQNKEKK